MGLGGHLTAVGRTPIDEKKHGEMPRTVFSRCRGNPVFPVFLKLNCNGRESCSEEISIKTGVVAPSLCVGKDGAVELGRE